MRGRRSAPPSLHPQRPQPQPARPKFDLDTPIETIAANAAGKTVLDTDLQNITAHPMYESFKGMSLNQVAPLRRVR